MIYVRGWEAHCPALFSAPTIEEARSIASRLGYKDVWYDVNGSPDETQVLREEIKELEIKLDETEQDLEEARDNQDCGHESEMDELEQRVDEAKAELADSKKTIALLGGHLTLMQDIVNRAS